MKFGILYNIDYRPEVHGSSARYYGQILDQIQIIEELGFDSVWFGEHHYAGYSFGAPAVIATAAAGRTTRLRLGTGVSLIPLHNPLCLAEEYAMLDVLSNGRLEYESAAVSSIMPINSWELTARKASIAFARAPT